MSHNLVLGESNTLSIERCEFLNNTAWLVGGAIRIEHRNLNLTHLLNTTMNDSRFIGNSAGYSGAVSNSGDNLFGTVFNGGGNIGLHVTQCSFVENNSERGSGALHVVAEKSEIVVIQSTFTRN